MISLIMELHNEIIDHELTMNLIPGIDDTSEGEVKEVESLIKPMKEGVTYINRVGDIEDELVM